MVYLNSSETCIDCPKYCKICTLNASFTANPNTLAGNYSQADLTCQTCTVGFYKNKVGVCLSGEDSGEAKSNFLEDNLSLVLVVGSFGICLLLMIGCLYFCYKSKSDRGNQTNPARTSTNISAATDISGKIQCRSVEKLNPVLLAQRLLQSNLTGGPQLANQSLSNSNQPHQDNSMSRLEKEAIGGMSESPKSQGGFKMYRSKGPLHKLSLKDRAKLARQPSLENSSGPNSQAFKRVLSGGYPEKVNEQRNNSTPESMENPEDGQITQFKEIKLPKLVESTEELHRQGSKKADAPVARSQRHSILPPLSPGLHLSHKEHSSMRAGAVEENPNPKKVFRQLKLELPVPETKVHNINTCRVGPAENKEIDRLGIQGAPAVSSSGDLRNVDKEISLPIASARKSPFTINPATHVTVEKGEVESSKSQPDLEQENEVCWDESGAFEPIDLAPPMQSSNSPNQTEFILERDPLGESSLDIERELNDTDLALPKKGLPK